MGLRDIHNPYPVGFYGVVPPPGWNQDGSRVDYASLFSCVHHYAGPCKPWLVCFRVRHSIIIPNSLESSRINDFAQAKVEAGETLKTSNSAYRLISDSVKEFEATDKMSAAITAIYRPVGLRFTTPL